MLDFLTVTWNVSPDILSIGNFHLRWYSVLFVAGLYPIGYYIMRSFYGSAALCAVHRYAGGSTSGALPFL